MFLFSCFKAHVLIIYLFDKTTINTNLQMASSTFFAPINSILNFILICMEGIYTWLIKRFSIHLHRLIRFRSKRKNVC